MNPQVSYCRRFALLGVRVVLSALVLSFGPLIDRGPFSVEPVAAKPMPAIESAWIVKQAQFALEALRAAEQISQLEQRDVAARWLKSIAVIVAEHLEIEKAGLERAWFEAGIERQRVLFAALTQLGVPYKANADEPGVALDCSALIKFAWNSVGLAIPRGSQQQYSFSEPVRSDEVQVGDLAWYPGHIAMSLGVENVVIQAPRNGRSVEVHKIDETRVKWMRWVDPNP